MTPNIVIHQPVSVHIVDDEIIRVFFALLIALALLSLMFIVVGFICDGIKHRKWTLRVENGSFFKNIGYAILAAVAFTVVLSTVMDMIYGML